MTQIFTYFGEPLVHALGWTFVHSLWQASLIALVMTALLHRIPEQQAQKRYLIATISLAGVLACSVITFMLLYQQPSTPGTAIPYLPPVLDPVEPVAASPGLYEWISQYNPFLVSIWILGVLFFALRFIFGLLYLRHMKLTAVAAPGEWQQSLDRIVQELGLQRPVRLVDSSLLRIPVVIGYIKPVILFPVGILNQLQVDEVEAILAHEVAHLVRNDFLQNLIQSLIEMIFYYHPAVWWISAVVRSERENCCDDLAVQVCSSSLTYAKALVRLEDISYHAPALALPFAGSKNHLLNRIKRILNQPQNKSNVMERIIATVILVGCVALLSFSEKNAQSATDQEPSATVERTTIADVKVAVTDSLPQQREITIWKSVDGKDMEMRTQDGEVKSLKIDGTEIDPSEYHEHQADIEAMKAVAEGTPALPPLPPLPALEPVPPLPPMAEMPAMPPMPAFPALPDLPPPPPAPSIDHLFYLPGGQGLQGFGLHENKTNKTTIIREKTGTGYSYHVESDGDTEVEIDGDRGIAIVNGQEIELDADSVFVIESVETQRPGITGMPRVRGRVTSPNLFYGKGDNGIVLRNKIRIDSLPGFNYNFENLTPEQKAELELRMQEWGKQWEEYGKAFEGAEWEEYSKQWEEWGKQWEEQDWKAYQKEWQEYNDQWTKEYTEQWKEYSDKWKNEYGDQWKQYAEELEQSARQREQAEIEQRSARDQLRSRNKENTMLHQDQQERARLLAEERVRLYQIQNDKDPQVLRLERNKTPFSSITSTMDREGLIDADGEYNIVLEEDKLRINGKRMPDDVHEKYLKLFERTHGYPVTGKTKIEISN